MVGLAVEVAMEGEVVRGGVEGAPVAALES